MESLLVLFDFLTTQVFYATPDFILFPLTLQLLFFQFTMLFNDHLRTQQVHKGFQLRLRLFHFWVQQCVRILRWDHYGILFPVAQSLQGVLLGLLMVESVQEVPVLRRGQRLRRLSVDGVGRGIFEVARVFIIILGRGTAIHFN